MIRIDKPNMFKEALRTGINIFAGAGFSKLPAPDGGYLPDANELSGEICKKFSIPEALSDDLEKVSNLANIRVKDQFQKYLREKYTVSTYNPLYDLLNRIAINAFITTNIDNIVQCVMDRSTRYSLHDIAVYGASKKGTSMVPFIPLHGNVKDITSHLYFGKSELANVDNDNRELFSIMHSKLLEVPTLFWGYGFHDNAIERTVAKVLDNKTQNIWIQCMPGNKNIDYFRALGCFVIEGTTEELFHWIESDFPEEEECVANNISELKQYAIPSRNQLEVVPMQDYYVNGVTHWYCILSNYAYETQVVDLLYEAALENKNVIAVGIPFSGKTTIMMQLAAKMRAETVLAIDEITVEEGHRIINALTGRKALVLIDNCCDDAYVTKLFMEQRSINVVGFANDFVFESAKHLLDGVDYRRTNIDELRIEDAQGIFQKIPDLYRKSEFAYKENDSEKFSMLEFLGKNMESALSDKRVYEILKKIHSISKDGFRVIALTVYLTNNKSALTTDVLCSYFGAKNYEEIRSLIEATQGYLSEYEVKLLPDEMDQDFFSLRSHLFAYYANRILMGNYRTEFAEVIRTFIENVSPYRIYRHNIFRRSAYDARFFKGLFGENAHDLYEIIHSFDGSAYSLQQWALYKAYLGDFAGAFADIDRAINQNPKNFSIRNSHAIILFEANKDKRTPLAREGIMQAMDTLRQCYNSDKRKVYHAQKYAEFSIYIAQNLNDVYYLEQAYEWLKEIVSSGSISRYTKKLLDDVRNELAKCN